MRSFEDASWVHGLSLKQAAVGRAHRYAEPGAIRETYVAPSLVSAEAAQSLLANADHSPHISTAGFLSQVAEILATYRAAWGICLSLFRLHLGWTGWMIARSSYLPQWLRPLFFNDWACAGESLAIYLYPEANLGLRKVFFAADQLFHPWLLGWGWSEQAPMCLAEVQR